jgi:DNA repair exonuclease SbcCD ATPase subunit
MVESAFGAAYKTDYTRQKGEWLASEVGRLNGEVGRLRDANTVLMNFQKLLLPNEPTQELENVKVQDLFTRMQSLLEVEEKYLESCKEVNRLRVLEKQHVELHAKMRVLADRYASVAAVSQELPARRREREEEAKAMHDEIRRLKLELEAAKSEIASLGAENISLKNGADAVIRERLGNMERAYFKEKSQRERLEADNDKLRPLQGTKEDLEELQSKCAVQATQLQHFKVLQKRCLELQSQANAQQEATKECARLRSEVDRLASYQDLYLSIQKDVTEVQLVREERSALQAKLDYVEREKVTLERQLAALQGREFRHLDAERDSQAFSRMLERKVQEVTEENAELRKQLHKATLERATAIAEQNQAEGEARLLHEQAKSLARLPEKVAQLERTNQLLTSDLEKLNNQINQEDAEKAHLREDTETMRKKLEKLQELKAYHFLPSLLPADSALAARGSQTAR